MQLMITTPNAELLQLQPTRIIPPILLGGVVPSPARRAFECNRQPISLLRHCFLSLASSVSPNPSAGCSGRSWRHESIHDRVAESIPQIVDRYSSMLVTTPAPTVRPPSRIANRKPSSIATGVINSTPIWTLSPGITISTPSGKLMLPVTSVVRM